MTMKRLRTIAMCIGLSATAVLAQPDVLVDANRKYQEGDLKGARTLLDQAVKEPDHARSPEAWVLRGFVYKDLYKAAPQAPDADLLRDEALASLFVGTEIDTAKQYAQSSLQAYDYLSKTIYNDAARALNDMDHERALLLYSKYKEALLRVEPKASFTARDIEFENALGTVYTKRFNQDRQQLSWYDKAVATYKEVLKADSNNYGANYNLATLYYNRGVYNIQRISADNDIPSIQQIQEASREFFTLALPYMLKAHRMNPKRKETLLGLEGIHYSLQDTEQSEHYRHLYEQLEHDGGGEKEP